MTQGMITITKGGIVLFKIVAGCDGYNVTRLAKNIKGMEGPLTRGRLYEAAITEGFGCKDCLVVMDLRSHNFHGGELPTLYRQTFNQAKFNPRWDSGKVERYAKIELP